MIKSAYKVLDGVLQGAKWRPSENFNDRPVGLPIDVLVIHNISLPPAQFENGYVELFFQNQLPVDHHPFFSEIADLKVSAHLFISRGGKVTQFVNLNHRAWHAGVSSFKGRENCNDFSIGIEMEGTDTEPYTDRQYQVLIEVTQAIQNAYPGISNRQICGHCDIAPERKTDPGDAFDWKRYKNALSV